MVEKKDCGCVIVYEYVSSNLDASSFDIKAFQAKNTSFFEFHLQIEDFITMKMVKGVISHTYTNNLNTYLKEIKEGNGSLYSMLKSSPNKAAWYVKAKRFELQLNNKYKLLNKELYTKDFFGTNALKGDLETYLGFIFQKFDINKDMQS